MKKLSIAIVLIASMMSAPYTGTAQSSSLRKLKISDSMNLIFFLEVYMNAATLPMVVASEKKEKKIPSITSMGPAYHVQDGVVLDTGGKWLLVSDWPHAREYFFSTDSISYWSHDTLIEIRFLFTESYPYSLVGLRNSLYGKISGKGEPPRYGFLAVEEAEAAYPRAYAALRYTGNVLREVTRR